MCTVWMITCLRYAGYHSDTALLEPQMGGSQVRVPVGEGGQAKNSATDSNYKDISKLLSLLKHQPHHSYLCDVSPRKPLLLNVSLLKAHHIMWCNSTKFSNVLYEKNNAKRVTYRHQTLWSCPLWFTSKKYVGSVLRSCILFFRTLVRDLLRLRWEHCTMHIQSSRCLTELNTVLLPHQTHKSIQALRLDPLTWMLYIGMITSQK
jgi:hypothetical protein